MSAADIVKTIMKDIRLNSTILVTIHPRTEILLFYPCPKENQDDFCPHTL